MFKALFKKQLLELGYQFFRKKNKKGKRTKGQVIGLCCLFGFLFISVGFAIYGLCMLMGDLFLSEAMPVDRHWLFFAIVSLFSILLGTFGSVFTTYTAIYQAKDNELLLSMPIPTAYILAVRLFGVYLTSFIFVNTVWIPAIIYCIINQSFGVVSYVAMILNILVTPFLVTVLSCLLGWLVALASRKIQNKSFAVVFLTLLLLGGYYFVYFRLQKIIQSLAANSESVSHSLRIWVYPIYQLSLGCMGKIIPFIIYTLFVALITALCVFLLSKTFIKITTSSVGIKKKEYTGVSDKVSSVEKALFRRELKHFLSSPVYLMNGGLGILILPIGAIVALVKKSEIDPLIQLLRTMKLDNLIPVVVAMLICLVLSMDAITAPSISLEGKNLWIVRSLPIETIDILRAKEKLHTVLNSVPAVIASVILGYVVGADISTIVMIAVCCLVFVILTAKFGLVMNLNKPVLDWTNESVPVKQSSTVFFALFGGWAVCIAIAVGYYFLRNYISAVSCLVIVIVLFALASRALDMRIRTKGVSQFEEL